MCARNRRTRNVLTSRWLAAVVLFYSVPQAAETPGQEHVAEQRHQRHQLLGPNSWENTGTEIQTRSSHQPSALPFPCALILECEALCSLKPKAPPMQAQLDSKFLGASRTSRAGAFYHAIE